MRTVVLGLTAAQAEFLGLAECEEWRSSLTQEAPVEVEAKTPEVVEERPHHGIRLGLLFLECLAASFVIVTLTVVLSIVF